MNAQQRQQALTAEAAMRSKERRERLLRFGTYAMLALFLVFVQLPLFWMILTAFKQRGQAFQMRFWPQTNVRGTSPYQLASIGTDQPSREMPEELLSPRERSWRETAPDGGATLHLGFLLPPATKASLRLYNEPARYVRAHLAGGGFDTLSEEEARAEQEAHRKATEEAKEKKLEAPAPKRVRYELLERPVDKALDLAPDAGDPAGPRLWSVDLPLGAGAAEPKECYVDFERTWSQGLAAIYTAQNFNEIWNKKGFPFSRYFFNSLQVATGAGLMTVILCSLAAYGFSRKKFPGSDKLFYGMLASMLIPGMVFMVPQFAITLKLGWMNTYWGLVVPHLGNVFGLFLLKQHMDSLPEALFQAARIDGANDWQIYWMLALPLSAPIVITLFLLVFVGQWSNFLWQFIVNSGDSLWVTLPVGLQSFKGQYDTRWELIMAGACFSIVPIAILFATVQRYFLIGMTGGSVKE